MQLTQAVLNILSINAILIAALLQADPDDVQGQNSTDQRNKKAISDTAHIRPASMSEHL